MNRLSRFGLLIVLGVWAAVAGGCNGPAGGGATTQAAAIQRIQV
ncbi:hypothetical protein LCGC14_1885060, partial [marine sediment metagenome]